MLLRDVKLGPLGSVGRVGERAAHKTNRVIDVGWSFAPGGRWFCPCCNRKTQLSPTISLGRPRRYSRCPHCGASERHRLAYHAFEEHLRPAFGGRSPDVLHFAPEAMIGRLLKEIANTYETADLYMPGVDHVVDLADLPFADESYDLLWASHVLAIIKDDRRAISEIRRVLRPHGVAVLPIPILGDQTIDYPTSVSSEWGNWHGPGWDYEKRFQEAFNKVEWYRSTDAPARSQTFLYEDRSRWPTPTYPYRRPSPGAVHEDGIPICWV